MILIINNLIKYGLYIFVFLLPWQTRWIYQDAIIKGGVWEYGRWSLYGTEVLLIILLILMLARLIITKITNYQLSITNQVSNIKIPMSKMLFTAAMVFVVWAGLSIVWAGDKGLAWYGWLRLFEGFGLLWLMTNQSRMVHGSITDQSRTGADSSPIPANGSRLTHKQDANSSPIAREWLANSSRIFIVLIMSGLVQAIFGISQFMRQANLVANKWLGLFDLDITNPGASVIEFLDQRWLRAYGSFPHPNILGGFLAVCLLMGIINLWRSDKFSQGKKYTWLNIFYWLAAVIIFLGLLVTFSRGAWLAFLIPFSGSFVYCLIKKAKNIVKINAIVLACFIGLIGLFILAYPYQLITTRFDQTARLEKMSMDQRVASYHQAESIIKNNPIFGAGLNNYTVALQKSEPNRLAWYYQPAHNVYLLVFAELGVIGLGSLFMILISLAVTIIKQRNRFGLLLLPLLIIGLFDHYLWSLYCGIMLWWLIAGLLARQTPAES